MCVHARTSGSGSLAHPYVKFTTVGYVIFIRYVYIMYNLGHLPILSDHFHTVTIINNNDLLDIEYECC